MSSLPLPSAPTRAQVLKAWAPALAYMALIFLLSSFQLQAPAIDELPFKDKLVHTIVLQLHEGRFRSRVLSPTPNVERRKHL